MSAFSTVERLFLEERFVAFLSGRWTLRDFLSGRESVWSCQGKSFVFAFSKRDEGAEGGKCLLMVLVLDPEIHTGFALDFDYEIKVEIHKKAVGELSKTEVVGKESTVTEKRRVVGSYVKALACDLDSSQMVDVGSTLSHFDHLRLWGIIQDFCMAKLTERDVKDTLNSILRMCVHSLKSLAGGD